MFKKSALSLAVAVIAIVSAASSADAAIVYRRIAPVRTVAARAVLPPYGVVRRAAYRPVIGYPVGYGAVTYGSPVFVGPRVLMAY
jgi:hypothetical protein